VQVKSPINLFRCPLQIVGLDQDESVFAPAGGDAFVALKYSLDFVGDLLKDGSNRLGLQTRNRIDASTPDHWIWRYPAEKGDACNH